MYNGIVRIKKSATGLVPAALSSQETSLMNMSRLTHWMKIGKGNKRPEKLSHSVFCNVSYSEKQVLKMVCGLEEKSVDSMLVELIYERLESYIPTVDIEEDTADNLNEISRRTGFNVFDIVGVFFNDFVDDYLGGRVHNTKIVPLRIALRDYVAEKSKQEIENG